MLDRTFAKRCALAVCMIWSGCGWCAGPTVSLFSAKTFALRRCDGADSDAQRPEEVLPNSGVIRIFLPPHLNFSNVVRNVRASPTPLPESQDGPSHDGDGMPNVPPTPLPPGEVLEPFHIYLKGGIFPPGSIVLVRAIIQPNSDYTFYDEADTVKSFGIHGVGYGEDNSNVLCGPKQIVGDKYNPTRPSPRQVASLYLKTPRDIHSPFVATINIGLRPNATPETTLFIDPKIHNQPGP